MGDSAFASIDDALLGINAPAVDVPAFDPELDALQPVAASSTRKRIAVIDDSPFARAVIVGHLEKVGYDVVSFGDPLQALVELAAVPVDLVVTDWDMPGLDGAELCRRLKAARPELPVLILTGQQTESAVIGLNAGADDYMRKEKSTEELAARIATILRRSTAATELRQVFARYTSDAIVAHVMQNTVAIAGERREVTVLFADVRNFTAFSENHPPERVVAALNDVLGRLADAVLTREGTVDKFLGDGIMAVFGAPNELPDHPQRALAAALGMLHAIETRNRDCHPDLVLDVGIAINTGFVVAGSIGNERRTEYTCIGDPVNVASRLCAQADAGEILVGAPTFERFADGELFDELPPVPLKGKQAPVAVYRARRAKR